MRIALTHASGVPAEVDGVLIDTPAGRFIVAEACSGVKFLVAMVALGTLVAHSCFASAKRRSLFMIAAVTVPVLANGIRAWGTIYVAQSQGIEFAAGFDHIVYGWVFFALVMGGLLLVSWRYFDREPGDLSIDPAALAASSVLARLGRRNIGGWPATGAMLLLGAATSATGPYEAKPSGLSLSVMEIGSGARMDRIRQLP